MQVFIAEDNYYELERLRRQVQSWGSRHGGVSITAVQCVAEVGPADLRTYDAVFLDVELPGKDGFAFAPGAARCGLFGGYRVCYEPSGAFAQGLYSARTGLYHQARGAGTHRRCNGLYRQELPSQRAQEHRAAARYFQQDRYFLTEILYVEASNHSSIVYTYDKTQSYALTFAQMEKLLPAEDFKKCHRGYIVNLMR